ncbi:hypothetical protein Pint_30173 [Pistacia integerrima]|uniref:Uncharacterized protein n=1 Tax=Pistacia integerrima TaxID=434235 RepID=A0ACC0WXH7_9ROSI|nr:hypothetical protein Pint_30173 [Pistacia integerrima]
MKNGKILVVKLIAFGNGRFNPFRVVSIEELKRATKNFHEGKIIFNGFGYRLYNEVLQDHLVFDMKFDDFFETYMYYLNNILFASHMNHNSILKLIECCLETEIPILVFESVDYGTLPHFKPLQFTNRLKIAVEITNAIAYLHFRFPKPIIFRIIKLWNILIDEQNVAKLFDFSLFVSIPKGEAHIKDAGRGIMGFVALQYVTTQGCFNEKCDVFLLWCIAICAFDWTENN